MTMRAHSVAACRPSEVLRLAKTSRSPRTATPDAPRHINSDAGRRLPTYLSWPRLCPPSRTGQIGREVADCPDGVTITGTSETQLVIRSQNPFTPSRNVL